ncbi:MAG: bifunctional hydroxymethylpyrimidine kinase/phosphomethylpyrimidine kinase [Bacteroidales bacterium]|jgi:hydroxymethylpyrimidine/phosphomethylpyrimidine kinase|nr:bifunctional hydroxymethylpyrimidine kinase/phosphomethylpyrimidine kinase [Bacteroidales bacterium]
MKTDVKTYKFALTIAGSDSGGCAGIQADIKTFSSLGVFATSAITAITAQNTQRVKSIQPISPEILRDQITSVLEDFDIGAIKTGMLFNDENMKIIYETYRDNIPMVVDPVMIATSGSNLIQEKSIFSIKKYLYPIARVLTPNLDEASYLLGKKLQTIEDIELACKEFVNSHGIYSVLIKGGHLKDSSNKSIDFFYSKENNKILRFESDMINTNNTHGTGCTLSSAIAAYLCLGYDLVDSIANAKNYITKAIENSAGIYIGKGEGGVNHFHDPKKLVICDKK